MGPGSRIFFRYLDQESRAGRKFVRTANHECYFLRFVWARFKCRLKVVHYISHQEWIQEHSLPSVCKSWILERFYIVQCVIHTIYLQFMWLESSFQLAGCTFVQCNLVFECYLPSSCLPFMQVPVVHQGSMNTICLPLICVIL